MLKVKVIWHKPCKDSIDGNHISSPLNFLGRKDQTQSPFQGPSEHDPDVQCFQRNKLLTEHKLYYLVKKMSVTINKEPLVSD